MAKRVPSLSSKLSRSRRALAAFLLLGGAAMTGLAGSAAAHDHDLRPAEMPAAIAERLLRQSAEPADLADDWLAEECWTYDDCFAGSCAEALQRRGPKHTGNGGAKQPIGCKREQHFGAAGGIKGDAAKPVVNLPGIQDLIAWGSAAKQWISPLLSTSDSTSQTGETLAKGSVTNSPRPDRDSSERCCEEPINIEAETLQRHCLGPQAGPPTDSGLVQSQTHSAAPCVTKEECCLAEKSTRIDSPATQPPKFGAAALVGGSPIIATLPESYLAYDLSPEDAIAMRMYPIAYPQSSYLGARRTAVYGPIDGSTAVQQWRQATEPGLTVSTAQVASPVSEAAKAPEPLAQQQEADELSLAVAIRAFEIVQLKLAESWQWAVSNASEVNGAETQIAQAELQAPRRARDLVTPVLPTQQGRVLQVELACQTAIDVVMAQAARSKTGQSKQQMPVPTDQLARAAAVATACDQTAASLEKLAMALRRAGDSLIRQASIGAEPATLIR